MQLIENLFVGESVGNLGTVVYSLKRDIPVFRLYCLVNFADRNRMEILSSKELFTKKYRSRKGIIAGVAMGRHEAVDLLCYMLEEAAKAGRDLTDPSAWLQ